MFVLQSFLQRLEGYLQITVQSFELSKFNNSIFNKKINKEVQSNVLTKNSNLFVTEVVPMLRKFIVSKKYI